MATDTLNRPIGELRWSEANGHDRFQTLTLPISLLGDETTSDLVWPNATALLAIITVSPAGPVLRALQPDQTSVNGHPVAVRLLEDGDIIEMGGHQATFCWNVPIELTSQDDLVALQHGSDTPVNLDEQRKRLMEDVALARETFRQDRQTHHQRMRTDRKTLQKERQTAEQDRHEAKMLRDRARKLYGQFLKRMRLKWSAEREIVEVQKQEIGQSRIAMEQQRQEFELQRQAFQQEAQQYQHRLQSAWEQLSENQRRFLDERQTWERTASTQQEEFHQREQAVAEQLQNLDRQREQWFAQTNSRKEELHSLDLRIESARATLQELGQKAHAKPLSTTSSPSKTEFDQYSISLESPLVSPKARNEAERLLSELQEQELDLTREKHDLQFSQGEMQQAMMRNADDRAVVFEHLASLISARELWQHAEVEALNELEAIAKILRSRELDLQEQSQQLQVAEKKRREKEYHLWQLQLQLEQWHQRLHDLDDVTVRFARQIQTEATQKRDQLSHWHRALVEASQTWTLVRDQEREAVQEELQHWQEARHAAEARWQEAEAAEAKALQMAQKLATEQVAIEECQSQGTLDQRRLRVLRKLWDRHFLQYKTELETRLQDRKKAQETAEARLHEGLKIWQQNSETQATNHQLRLAKQSEHLEALLNLDQLEVIEQEAKVARETVWLQLSETRKHSIQAREVAQKGVQWIEVIDTDSDKPQALKAA